MTARRVMHSRRVVSGATQAAYLAAGTIIGLTAPAWAPGPRTSTGSQVATLLFAVGGGILALASVIFSLVFLVLQWAAGTFSLRLTLFRDDPYVWNSFGYVIGMLGYCMSAGLVVRNQETVPVVIPALCLALSLGALVLIRNLLFRSVSSIQLAGVLDDIDKRARAVIDALYPNRLDERAADGDQVGRDAATGPVLDVIRWRGRPATLREVDLTRLTKLARSADVTLVVNVGVGTALQEPFILVTTHLPVHHTGDPATHPRPSAAAILKCLDTGPERTFGQDPLFPFRLLLDIALRAQSPALNDPATANQCLDVVEGLLRSLSVRQLNSGEIHDSAGAVRVVLTMPTWEDFVAETLDDLALASIQSPMVLNRLRTLLMDLEMAVPEFRRPPIRPRQRLVERRLQEHFPLAWEHITHASAATGMS
jgi:uncharacterized membrane protein